MRCERWLRCVWSLRIIRRCLMGHISSSVSRLGSSQSEPIMSNFVFFAAPRSLVAFSCSAVCCAAGALSGAYFEVRCDYGIRLQGSSVLRRIILVSSDLRFVAYIHSYVRSPIALLRSPSRHPTPYFPLIWYAWYFAGLAADSPMLTISTGDLSLLFVMMFL